MTTLKVRSGTISVFNGVEPIVEKFVDADQEPIAVGEWLADGRGGLTLMTDTEY